VEHYLKENKMRQGHGTMILLFLLAFQALNPALAQESIHQVLDLVDLPTELNPNRAPGCIMEFTEEWILSTKNSSISKKVDDYVVSCEDSSDLVFPREGELLIKDISYEFSFMDLEGEAVHELQGDFIELISKLHPLPALYNPQEQLLSVHFHEEWILEAVDQEILKQVKGITPVIWQRRQTADGEAVHDAETGYPVYYKLKLDRIDLRQP
jgi:hypothetical protein